MAHTVPPEGRSRLGRVLSPWARAAAAIAVLWSALSFLLVASVHGSLGPWRILCAGVWVVGAWVVGGGAIAHYVRPPHGLLIVSVVSLAVVWGLYRIPPGANRDWASEHAHAPSVEFSSTDPNRVTVSHFRSFRYPDAGGVQPLWRTQSFDLSQLEGCDFIVVPFAANQRLAHTMVSFRFAEGPNLALSVEARREAGEAYSVLRGLLHQFELVYVIGDEEDLLGMRLERLKDTLYVHPVKVEPATCRQFLTDLLQAAQDVSENAKWYNTLRSNCTTNLVESLERTSGEPVAWDLRMLLPGGSAHLVYDLGLLDSGQPFEVLEESARIAPGGPPREVGEPFSAWLRKRL